VRGFDFIGAFEGAANAARRLDAAGNRVILTPGVAGERFDDHALFPSRLRRRRQQSLGLKTFGFLQLAGVAFTHAHVFDAFRDEMLSRHPALTAAQAFVASRPALVRHTDDLHGRVNRKKGP